MITSMQARMDPAGALLQLSADVAAGEDIDHDLYVLALSSLRHQEGLSQVGPGYYYTRLRDGTLGYFQRRLDDCWQAAVATLLQIPMPELDFLDVHLRDRWVLAGDDPDKIDRDATEALKELEWDYGYRPVVSARPPATGKYIGIIEASDDPVGGQHCVIVKDGTLLFDATAPLVPTDSDYTIKDVDHAIWFE